MAKSSVISKEIKEQVQQIVTDYNAANKVRYVVSFKGGFCYFSRMDKRPMLINILSKFFKNSGPNEQESQLARLKWTGNMDSWDLAIFLYSKETYTTDYWGFPGSEKFRGTVQSLMECNLYP